MLKKAYKSLAVILAGFAGGAISPWILGWINSINVHTPSDAVSIANTYIVFTTAIFIGVTVILAMAGYVFTQQFSAHKHSQESQLFDDLRGKLSTEEKIGISFVSSILDNSDVIRHVNGVLELKVDELIKSRIADSETAIKQASKEAEAAQRIGSQLVGNHGGES